MEHHMHHHNPPLHWGYSGTPPHTIHNTWVPPPSRNLKRSISESDCEDNYSETSSKETSPKDAGADSCQHLSRKKRRGVIEKKRRDRINSSLSELKRLVPSAYEKQGSSKLEKAEILQLTVDHLKTLHSKGIDSLSYDPQRFAADYHIIGFRECASEVARYLINHEGMDIQDPLRMRLMSHLQCFVAQREVSVKTPVAAISPSWSQATTNHHSPYPLSHHQSAYTTVPPPPQPPTLPLVSTPPASSSSMLPPSSSTSMYNQSGYVTPSHLVHTNSYPYVPNLAPTIATSSTLLLEPITTSSVTSTIQSDGSLLLNHSQQVHQQQQQQQQQQQHQQQHQQQNYSQHEDQNGSTYTDLSSNIHRNTSASIGYGNPQYPPGGAQGYGQAGSVEDVSSAANYNNNNKPYRPWGSGPEMAY